MGPNKRLFTVGEIHSTSRVVVILSHALTTPFNPMVEVNLNTKGLSLNVTHVGALDLENGRAALAYLNYRTGKRLAIFNTGSGALLYDVPYPADDDEKDPVIALEFLY